tara:strand:+ start:85 stop:957 length:873 start_codon:yes stop_codon:yes gene_type:complete
MTEQSPFVPALRNLELSKEKIYGPKGFRDYLKEEFGETHPNQWLVTAQYLSIQSLSHLDKALRDENVMIFRLGKGTFALIQTENVEQFFILDRDLAFTEEEFTPECDLSDLFPFKFMGSAEANAINLAIASGLLKEALGLSHDSPRLAPTSGNTSYTFGIKPSRNQPNVEWIHRSGQVEIDALLFAKRNDKWTLFCIEGKRGNQFGSLAKHKLFYPLLAVYNNEDFQPYRSEIEIVTVYLRCWSDEDHLKFRITECDLGGYELEDAYVSDLTPKSTRSFKFKFPEVSFQT